MCGLIGVFSTNEKTRANQIATNIYQDQFKRGSQGYGIIKINKSHKYEIKRSTEPFRFYYDLDKSNTNNIVVHHRNPTATPNLLSQTHPIFVTNDLLDKDYLIVHNGVVTDCNTLKEKHTKLGFFYTTNIWMQEKNEKPEIKFNDSESFAIEMALQLENKNPKLELPYSYAFIGIAINKKTQIVEKVIFGHSGLNPLKMANNQHQLIISSEGLGHGLDTDILYSCTIADINKLTKTALPKATTEDYWAQVRNSRTGLTSMVTRNKEITEIPPTLTTSTEQRPHHTELDKAEGTFKHKTVEETKVQVLFPDQDQTKKQNKDTTTTTQEKSEVHEGDQYSLDDRDVAVAEITTKLSGRLKLEIDSLIACLESTNYPDETDTDPYLKEMARLVKVGLEKIADIDTIAQIDEEKYLVN